MDMKKLVFLDESSINTGMTRLYGRAQSNERVVDCIPDVRFERISILSSVRANGETVPLVFEGTLNGELFKEYISQCLAPTLKATVYTHLLQLSIRQIHYEISLIRRAALSHQAVVANYSLSSLPTAQ